MNLIYQANSFGSFWQPVFEALVSLDTNLRITRTGLILRWNHTAPEKRCPNLHPGIMFISGEPWDSIALAFS